MEKAIVFYTFNIFKPGGTTRSTLNMINNSIDNRIFNYIYILNYTNFTKEEEKNFLKVNKLEKYKVKFISFSDLKKIKKEITFIITREEFLPITKKLKKIKNIRCIIGEIHAPMEFIKDKYLFLENIDVIKVNTKEISKRFKEEYKYNNVIYNYVSLDHIENIEKKRFEISVDEINFYIISRLEEVQKNISYAIRYVKYLKEKNLNIKLYIDGYGPDKNKYKKMIKDYNLENNIFLNSKNKPYNLIPISTANYETFGFSIAEGIYEYGCCLLYPGFDNVLKEIYKETNNIKYLTLNLEKDYEVLLDFIDNYKIDESNYIEKLKEELDDKNYMKNYFSKVDKVILNKNDDDIYKPKLKDKLKKRRSILKYLIHNLKKRIKLLLRK